MLGRLLTVPARERPDLLAAPVAQALECWAGLSRDPGGRLPGEGWAEQVRVAEIDPTAADTAAFCAAYDVRPEQSANCVVVATRRGPQTQLVACVVLATTRADVNGLVRRHVQARKASFAAMDEAVERTGMEYGGITPVGLPPDWPLLVDAAVVATPVVVVGSGLRRSKLVLPGAALAHLPAAQVIDRLGLSVPG